MVGKIINLYAKLFARKSFYKFHKFLYRLSLRGIGILNYSDRKRSGEEFFLKKFLRHLDIKVVFDIGANVGNYSLQLYKYNSQAIIYCFEPNPVTYAKLEKNVSSYKILPFNLGFSNKREDTVIYDYSNNEGSSHASLYKDVIETIQKGKKPSQNEVKLVTIDDFLREKEIAEVDLLKIDTEGHELNILKGAVSSLEAMKIKTIHFEFNEMNTVSNVFFKDFIDLLPNYEFFRMMRGGLVALKEYNPVLFEIFAYQNILAIRKDIIKRVKHSL